MIVSLVTTHIPLKKVPESISAEKIFKVALLSYDFLKRLGKKEPKIALCGLNPHAGEKGLLGDEEETIIKEALEKYPNQNTVDWIVDKYYNKNGRKNIGGFIK